MSEFKEYIATCGKRTVDASALEDLAKRFGWYSTVRRLLAESRGERDGLSETVAACRGVRCGALANIDAEGLQSWTPTVTADDIIDKFLHLDEYRITADKAEEGEDGGDVVLDAEFGDEDDIVSEELAEVYLSQGLREEALAIYHKLSLLNTEKSIYFAEIIDRIENNN